MQSVHPSSQSQFQDQVNTSQFPPRYKFLRYLNKTSKDHISKHNIVKNFSLDISSHRTTKSIKTLQKSKTPTHLTLSLIKNSNPFKTPREIFFHLKHLQNLSSLNLRLLNEESLSFTNIKLLSRVLSRLKRLTSLSIHFPESSHLNPEFYDLIALPLKRMARSLSSLSLYFTKDKSLNDSPFKNLALKISKLCRLQKFTLRLDRCSKINNIEPLESVFRHLPLLSEVSLCIGVSAAFFDGLFTQLTTLKYLKRLDIDFQKDDDSVCENLDKLNLSSLCELSITFNSSLDNQNMLQFSHKLMKFSGLKSLSLDFSQSTKIFDKAISHLNLALSNLKTLSSLKISFPGRRSEILDPVEGISKGIVFLENLTSLDLNFAHCQERMTSVPALAESLKHLHLLKNLNINLRNCDFINDETIEYLMEGVKWLKNLRNLSLNLSQNKGITNQGVSFLMSFLGDIPQLVHLELRLCGTKTDGQALRSLAVGLQQLPELDSFYLAFDCQKKGGYKEGFEYLFEKLRELKSLREVWLTRISESEVPGLVALKRVKCVKIEEK